MTLGGTPRLLNENILELALRQNKSLAFATAAFHPPPGNEESKSGAENFGIQSEELSLECPVNLKYRLAEMIRIT
jgi:hypothetical protein